MNKAKKTKSQRRSYSEEVIEVVRLIPEGKVCTYGAIASYLGVKGGARMVGWILNKVLVIKDVPAHRVVNRLGILTGKAHFDGYEEMEKLLKKEGVMVEMDKVIGFEKIFWDPTKELL